MVESSESEEGRFIAFCRWYYGMRAFGDAVEAVSLFPADSPRRILLPVVEALQQVADFRFFPDKAILDLVDTLAGKAHFRGAAVEKNRLRLLRSIITVVPKISEMSDLDELRAVWVGMGSSTLFPIEIAQVVRVAAKSPLMPRRMQDVTDWVRSKVYQWDSVLARVRSELVEEAAYAG